MPRPTPYSGPRRVLSQLVMWLVLAGTVGLAALVDRSVNRADTIEVSEPITHGNMTVRIPRGWKTMAPEGTFAVVSVREAAAEEGGRTLTIYRQRIASLRSPFEYLAAGGVLDAELLSSHETPFEPTRVAGSSGILATFRFADPSDEQPRKAVVACAVLPSRLAISVKLEGPGMLDAADAKLVERIAADIRVSDAPAMLPAGATVKWADGLSVKSPGAFRAIDDHDAQTTSRYFIDDRAPQDWASIEVVPCVYSPADGRSVLTTLAGAHDPRLFHATISDLAPGRYRIVPPEEQGAMPAVTYVAADTEGHAILATFRGTSSRAAEFESLWNAIDKSIHFSSTSYAKLLAAGRAQVAQIQKDGLDKLIAADEREEQWWRWVDRFAGHRFGWSHFRFESAAKLQAIRETRKRIGKSMVVVAQSWASSPDLRAHTALVVRRIGADPQVAMGEDFRQLLQVRRGHVDIAVTTAGQPIPTLEAPLPAEFIPGAWLPHLLGHFAATPMMIRTESLFGAETDFATAFQTVFVTPADAPAGSEAGTRVFTLEVNGTGKLSRWTIRPDGQLDRIDFADGLYCERSDVEAIRLSFTGDAQMTP